MQTIYMLEETNEFACFIMLHKFMRDWFSKKILWMNVWCSHHTWILHTFFYSPVNFFHEMGSNDNSKHYYEFNWITFSILWVHIIMMQHTQQDFRKAKYGLIERINVFRLCTYAEEHNICWKSEFSGCHILVLVSTQMGTKYMF